MMTVEEIQWCGALVRRIDAIPGQKVADVVVDLDLRELNIDIIKTCKYIQLNLCVDAVKNRKGEIDEI